MIVVSLPNYLATSKWPHKKNKHFRRRPDRVLGRYGSRTAAGHTKIESTVSYLGIEVDDALAIAEQVDV